jgi:hypothetical protein
MDYNIIAIEPFSDKFKEVIKYCRRWQHNSAIHHARGGQIATDLLIDEMDKFCSEIRRKEIEVAENPDVYVFDKDRPAFRKKQQ